MYKIILFLLLLMLLAFSAFGQTDNLQKIADSHNDSINSVAVVPGGDQIVVSVTSGDTGKLLVISLRDCTAERRFLFDRPITSIVASPSDSGAVWGGQGAYLKKWSVLEGKELYSVNIMQDQPIIGISASSTGTYLAIWSRSQIALINIAGDNGTLLWTKPVTLPISDVALDTEGGYVYIAGTDGTLIKMNFQGMMVNSFSLERPIRSLAVDTGRQALFMGMGSELMKFDGKNSLFIRLSTLPAAGVAISRDGNTLYLIGSGSYSLFSYPQMKLIHTQALSGNKLLVMSNGSSITFDNNVLEFFDFVRKQPAGKIFIIHDAVGFLSPDMNYYGNEPFRRAVANSLVPEIPLYLLQDRQPDPQKACYGLKAMMDALYMPTAPTQARSAGPSAPAAPPAPSVGAVISPGMPTVSGTAPAPAIQLPVALPAPGTPQKVAAPDRPSAPGTLQMTALPELPVVQNVAPPVLAPGTDIPSWVMRPGTLPPFSAVKSGSDTASALKEAKIKIRGDVARSVMKNMLEVEMVRNIPSDDVKKRFLWMVAGRVAMVASEYVIQTDMWVSPEGTFYVLAQVDTQAVNQIYDPIFQEEMNQLKTYGDTQYMNREPIKWE